MFGPDLKHHHVQEIAAPLALLFLLLSESPLNSSNLSPSPLCFLGERRVRARSCQAAWSWGFCSSRSPRCCSCSLPLCPTLWGVAMNQTKYSSWQQMPLPSEPLCALTSAQTDGDQTGWTDQPAVLTRTRTHAHTLPVFLFKFNALWKTFYLLGFYSYPPNKQRSFSCSLLHIPLVPSPPCHIAEERCHQAAEKLTVTVTPSALRKLQCVAQMCIWEKTHCWQRRRQAGSLFLTSRMKKHLHVDKQRFSFSSYWTQSSHLPAFVWRRPIVVLYQTCLHSPPSPPHTKLSFHSHT